MVSLLKAGMEKFLLHQHPGTPFSHFHRGSTRTFVGSRDLCIAMTTIHIGLIDPTIHIIPQYTLYFSLSSYIPILQLDYQIHLQKIKHNSAKQRLYFRMNDLSTHNFLPQGIIKMMDIVASDTFVNLTTKKVIAK